MRRRARRALTRHACPTDLGPLPMHRFAAGFPYQSHTFAPSAMDGPATEGGSACLAFSRGMATPERLALRP